MTDVLCLIIIVNGQSIMANLAGTYVEGAERNERDHTDGNEGANAQYYKEDVLIFAPNIVRASNCRDMDTVLC